MAKALLLIDFEEEWRNPKSDYYLGKFVNQINKARRILEWCRSKGVTVIFTRHVEPEPTTAFKEGTDGTKIVGELQPLSSEKVITKHKISPFFKTDLDDYLRNKGVDEILVGGIMTNLCVRSTVSDAYDRDMKISVLKDVCVSDSKKTDAFTFADLKKTRPEVNVVGVSKIIGFS